jgi:ATP-dependent DNA ligase
MVGRRRQAAARRSEGIPTAGLPQFVEPQLAQPREKPPASERWVHEIKLDGYRIHVRIDGEDVRLLTRTGLDWTDRCHATEAALRRLKVSKPISTASSAPSTPRASHRSPQCRPRPIIDPPTSSFISP